MNCQFCGNILIFCHHENEQTTSVYDCQRCPVLVSFSYSYDDTVRLHNDFLAKVTFLLDRKGKFYTWTNNYTKGTSYITDLSVTLVSSMRGQNPLLIKFPKIMNINPSNVMKKLSFYLVWI
jgi:hypothetical protein